MVLVTGSAGLLGTALVSELLNKGVQVRALYNHTPLDKFNSTNLQQVQCTILDPTGLEDAMTGIEEVYHCAAIVTFNPSRKKEMFTANVEGTANVVNAALTMGVKKLVHVSSVAALGRLRQGEPINETMKWTPENNSSNYAESKYLGEVEVWRGIGEGLNAVIVNPSIILGGGQWNSGSSGIFKSVYNEFSWYTEGVSGFTDVRDVVKAMIALMESNISSERFIISAGNWNYRFIFNLIAKAFGKKEPHKKVTPFIAQLVWRLEAIKCLFNNKEPLITKETAASALTVTEYNNGKLLKFLPGFQYHAIEATIEHACNIFQQRLKAP